MLPTRDPAFHYSPKQQQARRHAAELTKRKPPSAAALAAAAAANNAAGEISDIDLEARSIAKLHEHLGRMEALAGAAEPLAAAKQPASQQQQQQRQQQQPQPQLRQRETTANNGGDKDDETDSDDTFAGDSTSSSSSSSAEYSNSSTADLTDATGAASGMATAAGSDSHHHHHNHHQQGGQQTSLPILGRAFSFSSPLPWITFQRLRRSHNKAGESPQTLTPTQEANVLKALGKIRSGAGGTIHDAVPVVSAVLDKLCPELPPHPPSAPGPRDGATFALLAVITGHADLLRACLELGSNPNDMRFLMEQPLQLRSDGTVVVDGYDESSDKNDPQMQRQRAAQMKAALFTSGASASHIIPSSASAAGNSKLTGHQLRHGFTPFFIACICEQLPCMDVLFEYGASLHTFDRWGRTPLHAAAAMGSQSVVDWLLAHGAPRTVPDRDSFRPGELWWGSCYPSAGSSVLHEVSPHLAKRIHSDSNNNTSAIVLLGAETETTTTTAAETTPATCSLPIPPRDPCSPHVLLRPQHQRLPCACGSGRVCGACGCVDDMHERWYVDRATARWLPGELSTAIAEAQASVLAQSFPMFVVSSSAAAHPASASSPPTSPTAGKADGARCAEE